MCRDIAHASERSYTQAAVGLHFHIGHPGQRVNVEQARWSGSAVLHETDKIGTSRDEAELRI
jgi:hypothetical protein